jgi:hypothetical protein
LLEDLELSLRLGLPELALQQADVRSAQETTVLVEVHACEAGHLRLQLGNRERVERGDVGPAKEEDRVLRRRPIQLGASRQPAFDEPLLVPGVVVPERLHPLARW